MYSVIYSIQYILYTRYLGLVPNCHVMRKAVKQ